jgi:hypothetical protein
MNEIFVTNKNDFPHEDAYDGEQFVFLPGEKVALPMAAATHMFGFNMVDKTETLVRLGWANLANDEGVKRLRKFVFTQAQLIERPVEETTQAESAA